MPPPARPPWQQATALVTLGAGGVVTGLSLVPAAPADLTSPASLPVTLAAFERTDAPAPGSDGMLRSAIVHVARHFLRLAETRSPAEMEAMIWRYASTDRTDHGPSCAAFASLTLELGSQLAGQESWVTGGTSYPWPVHSWVDGRVDPNPASPGVVSVLQDAAAHGRWRPLGDGYTPKPGDWVLFDGHVEVVTKHFGGVLHTIGGDSGPNLSVNAHEYAGALDAQGVTGFVDNSLGVPAKGSAPGGEAAPASPGRPGRPAGAPGGMAGVADPGPSAGAAVPATPVPSASAAASASAASSRSAASPATSAPSAGHEAGHHGTGERRTAQPAAGGPGPGQVGTGDRMLGPRAVPAPRTVPRARYEPQSRALPAQGARPEAEAEHQSPPAPAPQTEQTAQVIAEPQHARRQRHLAHRLISRTARGAKRADGHSDRQRTGTAEVPATGLRPAATRRPQPGGAAIPGLFKEAHRRPAGTGGLAPYHRHDVTVAPPRANDTASQQAFIREVARGAMATQRRYGVPASVTIAQAIDESGWGQSTLAANDHNLFGIKGTGPAGSDVQPTHEVINGQAVNISASFRVFHTVAQSIEAHARLLAGSQDYAAAMSNRHDPNAFAAALTGIYATDPAYGAKLIRLMRQYHLYRFDEAARHAAAASHQRRGAAVPGHDGPAGSASVPGLTAPGWPGSPPAGPAHQGRATQHRRPHHGGRAPHRVPSLPLPRSHDPGRTSGPGRPPVSGHPQAPGGTPVPGLTRAPGVSPAPGPRPTPDHTPQPVLALDQTPAAHGEPVTNPAPAASPGRSARPGRLQHPAHGAALARIPGIAPVSGQVGTQHTPDQPGPDSRQRASGQAAAQAPSAAPAPGPVPASTSKGGPASGPENRGQGPSGVPARTAIPGLPRARVAAGARPVGARGTIGRLRPAHAPGARRPSGPAAPANQGGPGHGGGAGSGRRGVLPGIQPAAQPGPVKHARPGRHLGTPPEFAAIPGLQTGAATTGNAAAGANPAASVLGAAAAVAGAAPAVPGAAAAIPGAGAAVPGAGAAVPGAGAAVPGAGAAVPGAGAAVPGATSPRLPHRADGAGPARPSSELPHNAGLPPTPALGTSSIPGVPHGAPAAGVVTAGAPAPYAPEGGAAVPGLATGGPAVARTMRPGAGSVPGSAPAPDQAPGRTPAPPRGTAPSPAARRGLGSARPGTLSPAQGTAQAGPTSFPAAPAPAPARGTGPSRGPGQAPRGPGQALRTAPADAPWPAPSSARAGQAGSQAHRALAPIPPPPTGAADGVNTTPSRHTAPAASPEPAASAAPPGAPAPTATAHPGAGHAHRPGTGARPAAAAPATPTPPTRASRPTAGTTAAVTTAFVTGGASAATTRATPSVYRAHIPPAVREAFLTSAKMRLVRAEPLYVDVASRTGLRWEILAACDWMQCKARHRRSPVYGERLGSLNEDGTCYRTRSAALQRCAYDLFELARSVYQLDIATSRELSVVDLAKVFAAFRWGSLLEQHNTSAMDFPYSVAGLTADHTRMRWPNIDEPNAPDKPGRRFGNPFGAVPVVLGLNYQALA